MEFLKYLVYFSCFIAQSVCESHANSIRGTPGVDYPDYTEIPRTSFLCSDHFNPGFYADPETRCQVFHYCYEHRQDSFLCPPGTVFNQAILSCDYWYSSECQPTEASYKVGADGEDGGNDYHFPLEPPATKSGDLFQKMASLYESDTGYHEHQSSYSDSSVDKEHSHYSENTYLNHGSKLESGQQFYGSNEDLETSGDLELQEEFTVDELARSDSYHQIGDINEDSILHDSVYHEENLKETADIYEGFESSGDVEVYDVALISELPKRLPDSKSSEIEKRASRRKPLYKAVETTTEVYILPTTQPKRKRKPFLIEATSTSNPFSSDGGDDADSKISFLESTNSPEKIRSSLGEVKETSTEDFQDFLKIMQIVDSNDIFVDNELVSSDNTSVNMNSSFDQGRPNSEEKDYNRNKVNSGVSYEASKNSDSHTSDISYSTDSTLENESSTQSSHVRHEMVSDDLQGLLDSDSEANQGHFEYEGTRYKHYDDQKYNSADSLEYVPVYLQNHANDENHSVNEEIIEITENGDADPIRKDVQSFDGESEGIGRDPNSATEVSYNEDDQTVDEEEISTPDINHEDSPYYAEENHMDSAESSSHVSYSNEEVLDAQENDLPEYATDEVDSGEIEIAGASSSQPDESSYQFPADMEHDAETAIQTETVITSQDGQGALLVDEATSKPAASVEEFSSTSFPGESHIAPSEEQSKMVVKGEFPINNHVLQGSAKSSIGSFGSSVKHTKPDLKLQNIPYSFLGGYENFFQMSPWVGIQPNFGQGMMRGYSSFSPRVFYSSAKTFKSKKLSQALTFGKKLIASHLHSLKEYILE